MTDPDQHWDSAHFDHLVLLALDEPVAADPEFDAHRAHCQTCQQELARLSEVVQLGRSGGHDPSSADVPPQRVWDAIVEQIADPALTPDAARPRSGLHVAQQSPVTPTKTGSTRRGWLLAAAAVVLLGGGAAVGAVASDHVRGSNRAAPPAVRASATLNPIGAPAGSVGTATVVTGPAGLMLKVQTRGLPKRVGYYEVWLFDPTANKMIAVGALGADDTGEFTVPASVDLRSYHVVDVSAQDFDGVAAHKTSMLQGPFTP
ncbi:MAG: anti-sigma factor [Jatrophihabitans sp.]